ncbi:MAG TPA: FkbM family methyltransferase [Phnomibacter sp.]|nr:FkbM family methyltransferase [Phnomibacter sp.]
MKEKVKHIVLYLTPRFLSKWVVHKWKQQLGLNHGYYQLSFSQQAEDLHIARFFNNKTAGFYIDVGAFHPVQLSNTYKFYCNGWHGINIEPNPDQFDTFEQLRPRDMNLNIAIGEKGQTLMYHKFDMPALNSFSTEHVKDWAARPGFNLLETVSIKTASLEDILDKHLPPNIDIDFMTVDVEGWDMVVLASNNWIKYRPTLLLVEFSLDVSRPLEEMPLYKYLAQQEYSFWTISGGTIFFRDNKKDN